MNEPVRGRRRFGVTTARRGGPRYLVPGIINPGLITPLYRRSVFPARFAVRRRPGRSLPPVYEIRSTRLNSLGPNNAGIKIAEEPPVRASVVRSKTIRFDYTFRHRLHPVVEQIGPIRRPGRRDLYAIRTARGGNAEDRNSFDTHLSRGYLITGYHATGSTPGGAGSEAIAARTGANRRGGRTGTRGERIRNLNLNLAPYPGPSKR